MALTKAERIKRYAAAIQEDIVSCPNEQTGDGIWICGWQPVSHVRKMVLANSFSYIPIFSHKEGRGRWMLIYDGALMRWIRNEPIKKKQKEMLALPVCEAIEKDGLVVKGAICCGAETTITDILRRMNDHPTLVREKVQSEERLLGILTAFDSL